MMENVPQLTEDQKIIIEALKAQQENVRTSKRLTVTIPLGSTLPKSLKCLKIGLNTLKFSKLFQGTPTEISIRIRL